MADQKNLSCVIGTAGHIDHGKTRLVKALTGVDCDRLKEEKKRGITIDLGFTILNFDDGSFAGMVDVPGHQKFIHNMVAGAAGIDVALLVVAADDGVMPQTVEHLAILETLGVARAVVAVTKSDLVDKETLLPMALLDIEETLSGSTISDAKIIPCSSESGEGIKELKSELHKLALATKKSSGAGYFRMPIDRVFTMKGHGVVVTGTLFSGEASTDQKVTLSPGEREARIRRIQSHGDTVSKIAAGSRCALNLTGLEKSDIDRGQVLSSPAIAHSYNLFTAKITCHRTAPLSIAHGRSYLISIHTRETLCKITLMSEKDVKPGESTIAQIRFEGPIQILHGDRFVLRASSADHTLGGGVVLEPGGAPMGRRALKNLATYWEGLSGATDTAIMTVIDKQKAGAPVTSLAGTFNIQIKKLLATFKKSKDVTSFDWKGETFICRNTQMREILKGIGEAVKVFHEENLSQLGIEEPTLISKVAMLKDSPVAGYWIKRAVSEKMIEVDGALYKRPGHEATFNQKDNAIRVAILDIYKEAKFSPPKVDTLFQKLSVNKSEAIKIISTLARSKELVTLSPEFTLHAESVQEAKRLLIEIIGKDGSVDTAGFRDHLDGAGRKAAIEILEYFDKTGVTKRLDNKGKRTLVI